MIHLIDPRYSPPPLDLSRPLGAHRRGPICWLSDRLMCSAMLVAIREPSGLWRITKGRWYTGRPVVRRKTLERIVLETIAHVEEWS